MQYKELCSEIKEILDALISDYSIPRNIKAVLDNARQVIVNKSDDLVAISDAVYKIQDICDDINLPLSVKSDIWMLLSKMEALKEALKR